MSHPPKEIVDIIKGAGNVLVATHVYPDGDALGSQIALGSALESLGKNVFLYSEEKVSYLYEFLPGSDKLNVTLPADLQSFDCAVALDCGDRFRLGREMERLLEIHPFIVIDHHEGHKDFGDIRWVDAKRPSTGELVYELAQTLKAEVSYEAAYCLYTAIVTDTGSFKYSSTTADTFRVAGELVAKGVKPSKVAGKIFDNFTVNRLQLLKGVLGTLTLHAGNRIAFINVTRDMFAQTGASEADTESFINFPRSLAPVKIAAFLKETKDGLISVSMRSKGSKHDVAQVARKFGGGGHRNAAGFKVRDIAREEVMAQLLREFLPMVD